MPLLIGDTVTVDMTTGSPVIPKRNWRARFEIININRANESAFIKTISKKSRLKGEGFIVPLGQLKKMPKKKSESNIKVDIRAHYGMHPDIFLFTNSQAYVELKSGKKARMGLGRGTMDQVGFHSMIVTQEMVGQRVAIAVGLELKKEGKGPTPLQHKKIAAGKRYGMLCGIVRSIEDAQKILFPYWYKKN